MPNESESAAPRNTISGLDIRALLAYIATGILTIAAIGVNIIILFGKGTIADIIGSGQIFVTAFTVIVALPIGIVVNASSFFILERAVVKLEQWAFKRNFSPIMGGEIGDQIEGFFGIDKGERFQEMGTRAVEMLKIYLPSAYRSYQHISGLGILFRVSAFLCLIEVLWIGGYYILGDAKNLSMGLVAVVKVVCLLTLAGVLLAGAGLSNAYLYWHALLICWLVAVYDFGIEKDTPSKPEEEERKKPDNEADGKELEEKKARAREKLERLFTELAKRQREKDGHG